MTPSTRPKKKAKESEAVISSSVAGRRSKITVATGLP